MATTGNSVSPYASGFGLQLGSLANFVRLLRDWLIRFAENRLAFVGGCIVLAMLLVAAFAP